MNTLPTNKVVCYYAKLNPNNGWGLKISNESKELVDFWKNNWKEKGWDPVILDSSYAKNHPFYTKLYAEYEKGWDESLLFNKRVCHVKDYLLECYTRWLAYAWFCHENGPVLWCDYDVLNVSFNYDSLPSKCLSDKLLAKSGSVGVMDEDISTTFISILKGFISSTDYNDVDILNEKQQEHVNQNVNVFSDMIVLQLALIDTLHDHKTHCTDCWEHEIPPGMKFEDYDLFHLHYGATCPVNFSALAFPPPEKPNFTRLDLTEYVSKLVSSTGNNLEKIKNENSNSR